MCRRAFLVPILFQILYDKIDTLYDTVILNGARWPTVISGQRTVYVSPSHMPGTLYLSGYQTDRLSGFTVQLWYSCT